MTTKPDDKVQLGCYVPPDINEWVNEVRELTGLHKSEVIHLLCAYARKFWTNDELVELADAMKLFGESGLERVASFREAITAYGENFPESKTG